MTTYHDFIAAKSHLDTRNGFRPTFMPAVMKDFQAYLADWLVWSGRGAIFADCGMGKELIQQVWATNVVRETNLPVLLLKPLAVSSQALREAEKFGIEAVRSRDGRRPRSPQVVFTNYELLHLFDPDDFGGVGCDECFAPDTPIDVVGDGDSCRRKYIKDIRVGDLILNAAGVDVVADVHRREVEYVVRVTVGGRVVTSSPNHPYFTQRGWVGAIHLRAGDHVLETAAGMRLVQDGVCSQLAGGETPDVLRAILLSEMADAPAGESVAGARAGSSGVAGKEADGVVPRWQPEGGAGARTLPSAQPNFASRGAGEDFPPIEGDRPRAFHTWRKRPWVDGAAGDLAGCTVTDAGAGVHLVFAPAASRLSDALQARLGLAGEEARRGGGWSLPSEPEGARPEEGPGADYARVDGIEILELGHPELEGLRDADGKLYLYDLGATRHPSFSVAGLLVHNSSILKSFAGVRRRQITEFMRRMRYRGLFTATAAPNDYTELGTSSEALGRLGHMDMLQRFFRNEQRKGGAARRSFGKSVQWKLRPHAQRAFWQWVCSWARAIRKPSDLGFDDGDFILPPLVQREHMVESRTLPEGWLFSVPAVTLEEQREEQRRTIRERCERVAELVDHPEPAVMWCHLNDEGNLLEELVPGAVQVRGPQSVEEKEEILDGFARGDFTHLVTKPTITGFGQNWQHCAHTTAFPSHSYERFYQLVRRFLRYGQKSTVTVDLVTTEGQRGVLANMNRKDAQAVAMFARLIEHMNDALHIDHRREFSTPTEVPEWL